MPGIALTQLELTGAIKAMKLRSVAAVREDLPLTKAQIGHTIIASVAITIVARLAFGLTRTQFLWNRHCERSAAISLGQWGLLQQRDRHVASLLAMTNWVRVRAFGWLCDRIGPPLPTASCWWWDRSASGASVWRTATKPSCGFRLAIGVIGAYCLITQYHASVLFAPSVVGTANALTAGWGNLGGGVIQIAVPPVFAGVLMFGVGEVFGWHIARAIPGAALLLAGIAWSFRTQDSPVGTRACGHSG